MQSSAKNKDSQHEMMKQEFLFRMKTEETKSCISIDSFDVVKKFKETRMHS